MSILGQRLRNKAAQERHFADIVIEGETVRLYAKPLTGAEFDKIMLRHKGFVDHPTLQATVDMIIMKAETEAGDKAFDLEDKIILLSQPLGWINNLRAKLFPEDDFKITDETIGAEAGN